MRFRGKRKSPLHETKKNLLVWLGKGAWAEERERRRESEAGSVLWLDMIQV